MSVTLLKKVNSTQRFSFVKAPTKKDKEVIFLCLCVTVLKKVNSTQRFSFAKDTNKKRNWNYIFLFVCYSFENGKQYTDIFLCKQATRENIEIIFLCLYDTLLKKVNSTQRFSFAKESNKKRNWTKICPSLLKKVNSTQRFSCVLFTFFKHTNTKTLFQFFFQMKISVYRLPFWQEYHTNTKKLYQFHFLLLSFKKGK